MNLLIIIAIFLIPIASIVVIKGTIVWFPQLLALQMMGGACFASMFWKLNKFLALFIGYLFFSYIYVTSASPRPMMCLLIGCASISITLAASKLKNLKWIYIALAIMSLLSILYCVLQAFGIDPIFFTIGSKSEGIVSFMGSHNQLGIYSVASAFWYPWLIPLALIPIYLSTCNSALIGLFAGCLAYVFFKYGKKCAWATFLIASILAIPWWHYCHKSSQEISERLRLWKLTLKQITSGTINQVDFSGKKITIKTSPFTGFGLGNFFIYSAMSQYEMYGLKATRGDGKIEQHFYEHAHNDLLEALYEFGYIGFSFLILAIGSVVFIFISSVKSLGVITTFSSLVAQSVTSFSVYVFHCPVSLFMFCLTLGLFYAEINIAKTLCQISKNT